MDHILVWKKKIILLINFFTYTCKYACPLKKMLLYSIKHKGRYAQRGGGILLRGISPPRMKLCSHILFFVNMSIITYLSSLPRFLCASLFVSLSNSANKLLQPSDLHGLCKYNSTYSTCTLK